MSQVRWGGGASRQKLISAWLEKKSTLVLNSNVARKIHESQINMS